MRSYECSNNLKIHYSESRSLFVVLLLQNGRCYAAEICAILLLLKCTFRWNSFLPKSNFSDFGQKPWTIIRRFGRNRGQSLWSFYSKMEGAMKLNLRHSAPLEMPFPMESFLPKSKFSFSGRKPWTIVHGLIFGSPKKFRRKGYHWKGHLRRSRMAQISPP